MSSAEELTAAPLSITSPVADVNNGPLTNTAASGVAQPLNDDPIPLDANAETSALSPSATELPPSVSGGIQPTAPFVPDDAPSHPAPAPSEPIDTGADVEMADLVQEPGPTSSLLDQTETNDISTAAADAPAHSNGESIGQDLTRSPPAADPDISVPDASLSFAQDPARPLTPPSFTQDPARSPAPESGGALVDAPSASSPGLPESAPAHVTASVPALAPEQASADQEMQDAPSSSRIRTREDDSHEGEPDAKRSRVDEPTTSQDLPGTAQPLSEFKIPDLPTPPTVTNGHATLPSAHPAPPFTETKSIDSGPMTPQQKQVLVEKMKNTKKAKAAAPFLKPVDIVQLNIPHYPDHIKNPMDLSTMEQKLKNNQYRSLDDFVADFQLMVDNCVYFNGPTHAVSQTGQTLRAYFLKQMQTVPRGNVSAAAPPFPFPTNDTVKDSKKSKRNSAVQPVPAARRESRVGGGARTSGGGETYAPLNGVPQIRRDSTADRPKREIKKPVAHDELYGAPKPKRKQFALELKFSEHVVNEIKSHREFDMFATPFMAPVDPVALQIPHYFSVVKKPMDFGTIMRKLKNSEYERAVDFKRDFELMIGNCYEFNGTHNARNPNVVSMRAHEFEQVFNKIWSTKGRWEAQHRGGSAPYSAATTPEADEDDEDEDDGQVDEKTAMIATLSEQLSTMQAHLASLQTVGVKASKKKTKAGVPKKKFGSLTSQPARAPVKAKAPKKQRGVTYEEKQEISRAVGDMNDEQVQNVAKIIQSHEVRFKGLELEEIELDIDELSNPVQHMLLKFVRQCFGRPAHHTTTTTRDSPSATGITAADDDVDYEPDRAAHSRSTTTKKKKHRPMTKDQQDQTIAEIRSKLAAFDSAATRAGAGAGAGMGMGMGYGGVGTQAQAQTAQVETSGDDEGSSSEEE
ncbi:transcription initiation at TATA-containing promoter protein [Elasticomyces elasticus]|nr:transcription initiation at TATA-containing promoter protein [Elasticomyces elasticus]